PLRGRSGARLPGRAAARRRGAAANPGAHGAMRIAILARNPKLYSHRRLVEAAAARGHQVEVINTLRCYMNITSARPEVRYQGRHLRCLVIGQEVVAAMARRNARGEFRANLHRGGKAEPVAISDEERATAVKAAETLGLSVAGIDILRSSRGPLVLEVNSSPG